MEQYRFDNTTTTESQVNNSINATHANSSNKRQTIRDEVEKKWTTSSKIIVENNSNSEILQSTSSSPVGSDQRRDNDGENNCNNKDDSIILKHRHKNDRQQSSTHTTSTSDHTTPNKAKLRHLPKDADNYKKTGIKSKRIKLLVHPLDHLERNILIAFILAIVFTFIALISGIPTVLLLVLVSIPVLSIQHLIYMCANLICRCKIRHKCEMFDLLFGHNNHSDNIETNSSLQPPNEDTSSTLEDATNVTAKSGYGWKYCPLDYLESYWFKPNLINHCILFIEKGLTIEELRTMIQQHILSDPELRKFRSRVVAKRFLLFKSLFWECLPNSVSLDFSSREKQTSQTNHDRSKESSSQLSQRSEAQPDHLFAKCSNDTNLRKLQASSSIQYDVPIPDSNPSKDPLNHRPSSPSSQSDCTTSSPSTFISIDDEIDEENKDKFSIEDHIIQDEPISSRKSLRKRNAHLLNVPLKQDKPLWQIRLAAATYTNQCVIIIRCHQSLADGSRLIAILVKCGILRQPTTTSDQNVDKDDDGNLKSKEEPLTRDQYHEKRFVNDASNKINILRACIVGPLTCLLWFIWAFSSRHYNHLNPINISTSQDNVNLSYKRSHLARYDYSKLLRIKQVTRSTVTEVILCALSGALREYLRRECYVDRPPNLNIGLTVDMRKQIESNDTDCIRYVLVNLPLPIAVEGTIPRLWETRHTMEELRSSADPWVMLGFQFFLSIFLPRSWYVSLINFIVHRNSSVCVSNINYENVKMTESVLNSNPENFNLSKLTLGNRSITKIYYCLHPPTKRIPLSFNCVTYNNNLFVSCSSRSIQIENSKLLVALFFRQLNQLSSTIAKRRIPGSRVVAQSRPIINLPEHRNRYQFRSHSFNIPVVVNKNSIFCPLHPGNNENAQYDLFKLINYPMTNLTQSSKSVDFIDKYSKLVGKCNCDSCRRQNLHIKTMSTSATCFSKIKSQSTSHSHSRMMHREFPSCQSAQRLKASPLESTTSLHDKSASTSTMKSERLNIKSIMAEIDQRNEWHTSASLSRLEDIASQRVMLLSSSPCPTTTSRVTSNSEGPVDLVRRQFNQLMGDINRRRSLASITEHQGLRNVILDQENDELGDGNTQLRCPTSRRLSLIGLAVKPGRRASLVPFGSMSRSVIPKSHHLSNDETQV